MLNQNKDILNKDNDKDNEYYLKFKLQSIESTTKSEILVCYDSLSKFLLDNQSKFELYNIIKKEEVFDEINEIFTKVDRNKSIINKKYKKKSVLEMKALEYLIVSLFSNSISFCFKMYSEVNKIDKFNKILEDELYKKIMNIDINSIVDNIKVADKNNNSELEIINSAESDRNLNSSFASVTSVINKTDMIMRNKIKLLKMRCVIELILHIMSKQHKTDNNDTFINQETTGNQEFNKKKTLNIKKKDFSSLFGSSLNKLKVLLMDNDDFNYFINKVIIVLIPYFINYPIDINDITRELIVIDLEDTYFSLITETLICLNSRLKRNTDKESKVIENCLSFNVTSNANPLIGIKRSFKESNYSELLKSKTKEKTVKHLSTTNNQIIKSPVSYQFSKKSKKEDNNNKYYQTKLVYDNKEHILNYDKHKETLNTLNAMNTYNILNLNNNYIDLSNNKTNYNFNSSYNSDKQNSSYSVENNNNKIPVNKNNLSSNNINTSQSRLEYYRAETRKLIDKPKKTTKPPSSLDYFNNLINMDFSLFNNKNKNKKEINNRLLEITSQVEKRNNINLFNADNNEFNVSRDDISKIYNNELSTISNINKNKNSYNMLFSEDKYDYKKVNDYNTNSVNNQSGISNNVSRKSLSNKKLNYSNSSRHEGSNNFLLNYDAFIEGTDDKNDGEDDDAETNNYNNSNNYLSQKTNKNESSSNYKLNDNNNTQITHKSGKSLVDANTNATSQKQIENNSNMRTNYYSNLNLQKNISNLNRPSNNNTRLAQSSQLSYNNFLARNVKNQPKFKMNIKKQESKKTTHLEKVLSDMNKEKQEKEKLAEIKNNEKNNINNPNSNKFAKLINQCFYKKLDKKELIGFSKSKSETKAEAELVTLKDDKNTNNNSNSNKDSENISNDLKNEIGLNKGKSILIKKTDNIEINNIKDSEELDFINTNDKEKNISDKYFYQSSSENTENMLIKDFNKNKQPSYKAYKERKASDIKNTNKNTTSDKDTIEYSNDIVEERKSCNTKEKENQIIEKQKNVNNTYKNLYKKLLINQDKILQTKFGSTIINKEPNNMFTQESHDNYSKDTNNNQIKEISKDNNSLSLEYQKLKSYKSNLNKDKKERSRSVSTNNFKKSKSNSIIRSTDHNDIEEEVVYKNKYKNIILNDNVLEEDSDDEVLAKRTPHCYNKDYENINKFSSLKQLTESKQRNTLVNIFNQMNKSKNNNL